MSSPTFRPEFRRMEKKRKEKKRERKTTMKHPTLADICFEYA